MILKVIGIILLVILALLLTAVLLILFVPVRYRADVLFEGKPDGEAAVSWLLHLVRIRVSYHEHADVSGRVLWFKLFDVRLWPPEDEEEQKTKSETGWFLRTLKKFKTVRKMILKSETQRYLF